MSDKPKDDVFESDPFFSQEPVTFQPEPESSPETGEPAAEPDVVPPETDDASFDVYALEAPETEPPPPVATAEERLLNSIVGEPEAAQTETPPPDSSAELTALQAELEDALAKAKSAVAAHTQTRQDLQILKTRFSTLESDLAAARAETAKAVQMKVQAETMHADTERQWSDKLAQLRRMLDEVEEIRDEQLRKRVPKLLFIGTLVTGVLGAAFAYFIGANQAAREQPADNPPPAPRVAVAPPVLPPARPLLTSGPAPAPRDVVSPRPVPAGSMAVTPVAAPVRSVQPQVLQPANWPALEGNRWRATEIGREMVVTFHYGTFTRGVELSSEARQDLKTIATAIKAKGNRFRIEVEGHTDSAKGSGGKSSASNNKSLGLARAKAAASYLVKSCGLPATAVTTSSAGEDNPPYPNTTPENQKKNRTVVIKITASKPQ